MERRTAKEESTASQGEGGGSRLRQSMGDEDGEGYEVQVQPPPPPHQPLVLPLPGWLQKALGKDLAACRKGAAESWFAQVVAQGYGLDQPIFSDPIKNHYTLCWVMRPLFPVRN